MAQNKIEELTETLHGLISATPIIKEVENRDNFGGRFYTYVVVVNKKVLGMGETKVEALEKAISTVLPLLLH